MMLMMMMMMMFMCFKDYQKAFDCVDHEKLWTVLTQMGVPMHLVILLKELYFNQVATVRTEFGEMDTIEIGKGVRQGCILSPILFNIYEIYAENIMREALNNWGGGVKIGGHIISNMRYADDTTLLSSTEADLTELLERVKMASEKAGLYLNVAKIKLMATGEIGTVKLNGEEVEVIDKFQFLGVMITKDAPCEREIKRRLTLGRSAMGNMKNL